MINTQQNWINSLGRKCPYVIKRNYFLGNSFFFFLVYRFPRQGRNEKKLEKGWGGQNLGKDELVTIRRGEEEE